MNQDQERQLDIAIDNFLTLTCSDVQSLYVFRRTMTLLSCTQKFAFACEAEIPLPDSLFSNSQ